jgi:hypothetical protein
MPPFRLFEELGRREGTILTAGPGGRKNPLLPEKERELIRRRYAQLREATGAGEAFSIVPVSGTGERADERQNSARPDKGRESGKIRERKIGDTRCIVHGLDAREVRKRSDDIGREIASLEEEIEPKQSKLNKLDTELAEIDFYIHLGSEGSASSLSKGSIPGIALSAVTMGVLLARRRSLTREREAIIEKIGPRMEKLNALREKEREAEMSSRNINEIRKQEGCDL